MSTLNIHTSNISLTEFVDKLVNTEKYLKKSMKTILGYVGLIIVYPLLLPMRITIMFLTRNIYKKIKIIEKDSIYEINNMDDNELVKFHLLIERIKIESLPHFEHIYQLVNHSLPKGILRHKTLNYIKTSSEIMKEIEPKIKRIVYPELNTPILEENLKIFKKSFEDIEDWEDESYDIYSKVYLN